MQLERSCPQHGEELRDATRAYLNYLRTDLLLRRNGDTEVVVVEVKIWGRNDYQEAHRQLESYWSGDVAFGAVVQLAATEVRDCRSDIAGNVWSPWA